MMVTAILARNEADRYLERVVKHHRKFGPVLVLDDHSTDETVNVAEKAGALVKSRTTGTPMWGQESSARKELWEWGSRMAGAGWLLICDADQLLMGDPLPLCTSWVVNTWSFPLYDCWDSEDQHRADGFWQGYKHARPWLFRPSMVPEGWTANWGDRGIHVGHLPQNWPLLSGVAQDVYWCHLAYVRKTDRVAKHARYRLVADQLNPFERAHAETILDG